MVLIFFHIVTLYFTTFKILETFYEIYVIINILVKFYNSKK